MLQAELEVLVVHTAFFKVPCRKLMSQLKDVLLGPESIVYNSTVGSKQVS